MENLFYLILDSQNRVYIANDLTGGTMEFVKIRRCARKSNEDCCLALSGMLDEKQYVCGVDMIFDRNQSQAVDTQS